MGERCFIKIHNSSKPVEDWDTVDFTSGMSFEADLPLPLPVFWAALFTEEDISYVNVHQDLGDNESPTVTIPTLHAKIDKALDLYCDRFPMVSRWTREPYNTKGQIIMTEEGEAIMKNRVHPDLWEFAQDFHDDVEDGRRNHSCEYIQVNLHAWHRHFDFSNTLMVEKIKRQFAAFDVENDQSWTDFYGTQKILKTDHLYGQENISYLFSNIAFGGYVPLESITVDAN